MDDAAAVGLRKAAGDLQGDVDRLGHRQRPALDPAAQGLAVVAGHGEIEAAVRSLPQLQDGAEIGVVQAGGRPRLLLEPLLRLRIARQLRRQELEGNDPRQPGVAGLVDDPHPPAAEDLQNLVRADLVPGRAGGDQRAGFAEERGRAGKIEQRAIVVGRESGRRERRGEVPEPGAHHLHARDAVFHPLRQGMPHQPFEGRRHAGTERDHRPRAAPDDGPRELDLRIARERRPAGHHLVDHHPQRPDIRAGIGGLAVELLGGHVGRRAHGRAGAGDAGLVGELGDAEVDDLHPSVGSHHDVARLHVAVDDPLLMGAGEAGGDLLGDPHRLDQGERPALDPVAQRLPLAQGHGDEQRAVAGLVDLVDRADGRVVERRRRPGLADEALLALPGGAALAGEELERHRPVEPEIDRLVDDAHATAPEAIEDPIVGDRAADQREGTPVRPAAPAPAVPRTPRGIPGRSAPGRAPGRCPRRAPDGRGRHS